LVLGDLVLPLAALKIIEEASNAPEELQANFATVDQCSSISIVFVNHNMKKKRIQCLQSGMIGNQDECAAAAGIYQCGVEKAPVVTKAIRTELSPGTSASVRLHNVY
jgi:hypothetical protein